MGTMTDPFSTGEVIQSIKPIDGLTQEQKDNGAATGGLIMTAIGKLRYCKSFAQGHVFKYSWCYSKGFVTEGWTESLQELVVIGSESIAGQDFSPSEILHRLKEAGAAGGVCRWCNKDSPINSIKGCCFRQKALLILPIGSRSIQMH
jgi:hypothetical protein